MVVLDIDFQKGNEIEVVFIVKEKSNHPIDIWFVNEDNYLLLSGGAQFLFYMDGSQQQVSYVRKIVTLTEHDLYKLVITNYYNNRSVEVDVGYELRTFALKTNETKPDDNSNLNSDIFIYILTMIIVILVILVIILSLKFQSYKKIHQQDINEIQKYWSKKQREDKDKTKNRKSSKKPDSDKPKKAKKRITRRKIDKKVKTTTKHVSFCGYCGESVDTPYCKHCGRKV